MKKLMMIAVSLVATNAMAIDFDSEWAKFAEDFSKLKSKVSFSVDVPKVGNVKVPTVEATDADVLPSKNTQDNVLEKVDPRSPDRLGYKLEDPVMRDKMAKLYKKPDTVVYSITLTE